MILKKKRKGAGNIPARTSSGLDADKIAYYADREGGRANIDMIPLQEIIMDDDNPRTKGIEVKPLLNILPDFLILDMKHADYDAKKIAQFDAEMAEGIKKLCAGDSKKEGFFESLIPLRDNIRLLGVLQPIEVASINRYTYKIRYGHRRYIASILAGEKGIFSRIVLASRDDGKITQMSENAHQAKLRLFDRIKSLSLSLDELGIDVKSAKAAKVSRLLGMDRGFISNGLSVLKCDSVELMDAIDKGVVTNFGTAGKIALMNEEERSLALAELLGDTPKVNVQRIKKKGRARRFISTPKIKEPKVFINIMSQLNVKLDDLDLNDINAVQEKWDAFIKKMAKQCQRSTTSL